MNKNQLIYTFFKSDSPATARKVKGCEINHNLLKSMLANHLYSL